jgi:hypothetical protein
MALKIFLSKTPKMASSDFDNTQVSDPYESLLAIEKNNCFLRNLQFHYRFYKTFHWFLS